MAMHPVTYDRRSASCSSAMTAQPFTHERMRKIAVLRRSVKAQPITLSPTRARPDSTQDQRHHDQLEPPRSAAHALPAIAASWPKQSARCYAARGSCRWRSIRCRVSTINGCSAETRHQGQQASILAQDSIPRRIAISSRAIPWSTVFRPASDQARPSIPGFQPARVLWPGRATAALDDQGRLQVRLWPDTDVDPGRVHRPLAACRAGNVPGPSGTDPRLPLAGSDVLISFLDSDPDRPVLCASSGQRHRPPAVRADTRRSDTRLLLDWLINRPDLTP